MPAERRSSLPAARAGVVLCAVFFLSGGAALLFETLWFRSASLAFGSSIWASSLVLGSFMAGLALGNALAARFGDRLRRPLSAYGLCEVAIAVSGILLVLVLPTLADGLAPVLARLVDRAWALNLARLACGFLLLLVPASAMGLTLPVATRAMAAWSRSFGSNLGSLYGWNTLGAVTGAMAGEWVLIGWLGIRGTALAAAATGLLAAAVALILARSVPGPAAGPAPPAVDPDRRLRRRIVCCWCAAFVSGASMLALEVVWFRFLHLFVHGGSLAFAMLLGAVLLAIGIGGLIGGRWLRLRPAAGRHAPAVALVAGSLAIVAYSTFELALRPFGASYVASPPSVLWLAAALTFPTSLASGILFTLTGSVLHDLMPRAARATGQLACFNTAGAALGPLLAGFVLLPALGMEHSFLLLSGGFALAAALLAAARTADRRATRSPALWAAATLFAICVAAFPFGSMRDYMAIPIHRATLGKPMEVVAFREGRTETIVYLKNEFLGEPLDYLLMTDGFKMAGSGFGARRYMMLFVYLPVALRPDPRTALLISYGSGATARALTGTSSLERIDVVDRSREILELSGIVFPDPAEHPLHDPRVRVHVEDGRYFLRTTPARYDLITGEPPPPKTAGVVQLYTREYFELIHDRLNDGGVNTYWFAGQNLTLSDSKAILRAYCDVFPDCSLWGGFRLNWILLGSKNVRWTPDETAFRRQWEDPAVAGSLAELGFELPEQLGATFLAGPRRLAELTRDAPPLTDDRPKRLSDHLPNLERGADVLSSWMDVRDAAAQFAASEFIRERWPPSIHAATLPYFEYQGMVERIYRWPPLERGPNESLRGLHATLTHTPLRFLVLWQLGLGTDESRIMQRLAAEGRLEPRFAAARGMWALADRDYDLAADRFGEAWDATGEPRSLRMRLYALCLARRVAEAELELGQLAQSVRERLGDPEFWDWMAATFGLASPP